MSTNTCFLSTAIPYVNGSPHIGHAQEFVIADAIARHRRRFKTAVHFQSGTDDNSLKSARAAAALGVSPTLLVARHAGEFESLATALDVRFDDFVRTSADARHAPAVVRLWKACESAGDLERRLYRGLYCTGCEQFFSDGELPDNRCPEDAAPLEEIQEENYFFRASRYGETIRTAIETNTLRIEPEERRREVLRFLEGGLRDFPASRAAQCAPMTGVSACREIRTRSFTCVSMRSRITSRRSGTQRRRLPSTSTGNAHKNEPTSSARAYCDSMPPTGPQSFCLRVFRYLPKCLPMAT